MTDEQRAELKRQAEEMRAANGTDISALSEEQKMALIHKGAAYNRATSPVIILELLGDLEQAREEIARLSDNQSTGSER